MKWINEALKINFAWKFKHLQQINNTPLETQQATFNQLLKGGKHTLFGKEHHFESIQNYQDFQQQIPIRTYEQLQPYIQQMMQGKADILWRGKTKWFSRSSGTTGSKSKYIPVSQENLYQCHLKGGHDMMAAWYHTNPDTKIFSGSKGILMGGEIMPFDTQAKTFVGDVSAIMIKNMPFYAKYFLTPDVHTSLLSDWEEKIEKIAQQAVHQNITNISGVPTWTLLLFRRILELSGKETLSEVYPNFELYSHGGVHFEPYRSQFESLFPHGIGYRNGYNASEGFFAGQIRPNDKGMQLLLNNGVFFEFVPLEELQQEHPKAYTLEEVELEKDYALVVSTNAGLWRYLVGDTIRFVSLFPHQIQITGRTAQFINVFGEEVMVWNTDKALVKTCQMIPAAVADYSIAPIFMQHEKGGHEWVIEFKKTPTDVAYFAKELDLNLQKINSDYAAKRYKSMALAPLKLNVVPEGTFNKWLKSKGKLGGQNKVPRLSANRQYIEEILLQNRKN